MLTRFSLVWGCVLHGTFQFPKGEIIRVSCNLSQGYLTISIFYCGHVRKWKWANFLSVLLGRKLNYNFLGQFSTLQPKNLEPLKHLFYALIFMILQLCCRQAPEDKRLTLIKCLSFKINLKIEFFWMYRIDANRPSSYYS